MPPEELLINAVEAVVFASPEPVHAREIAEAFGDVDEERIDEALQSLVSRYDKASGGLFVEQVAGGYRLATRPEVGAWVRQFFRQRNRTRLTPATLEALAIVAYRQPITAPEIQAVRGKDPTYALKVLLEKKMIRILGRKKVVGNPLLYGTTKRFLEHFGLNGLSDLPSIDEFDTFVDTLEDAQGRLFGEETDASLSDDGPEGAEIEDAGAEFSPEDADGDGSDEASPEERAEAPRKDE